MVAFFEKYFSRIGCTRYGCCYLLQFFLSKAAAPIETASNDAEDDINNDHQHTLTKTISERSSLFAPLASTITS